MLNALLRGSMLLVGIVSASAATRADDNILGLPAPHDASKPGAVMLHGGGRLMNNTFDRFHELAGGKKAHIVLIPSAGYRRSDYDTQKEFIDALKRRFSGWTRLETSGQVAKFEFLHTDDPKQADDAQFVRPLASATGVWFCGGAQDRLNYRYVGNYPRQTRFQAALREVVARGGIVGGTSAGTAAMPEIMTLDQDRNRADGPMSVVAAHGLGLFNGAIVEQHFEERCGRLERFTGLLRDSQRLDRLAGRNGVGVRMVGLAVETSTALVLRSDHLEVVGAANAHVFIKSPDERTITWPTLKSGDKVSLKRDERGQVVLVTRR
jgi:cyanophycinase